MQPVESCCAGNFYAYVLAALFFIKIALKLSYNLQKNAKFASAGGFRPQPPVPPAAGGFAPRPQNSPPPLRISGGAPDTWLVSETTHLLHYFSITIHKFTSTSPVFTHKILF